jgi:hypothetical protein
MMRKILFETWSDSELDDARKDPDGRAPGIAPTGLWLKAPAEPDRSSEVLAGEGSSFPATLSRTRTLLYSAASVGAGVFDAFNNFILPPILQSFGASNLLIGLLSSTRSIEGAIIQPSIGALSDRIRTPLGRRRPFMLAGIPVSAIFVLAAGSAPNLLLLALAIFLFSVFYNIASDPYAALLPDIATLRQRGVLSGIQEHQLVPVPVPLTWTDSSSSSTVWSARSLPRPRQ